MEAGERLPPWAFGIQTNERLLRWDDAAQLRLLVLHASQELGLEPEVIEAQVDELQRLLPDLMGKAQRMKAQLFLRLIDALPDIATKLIRLRELLPGVNVSMLVARHPACLLDLEAEELAENMATVRDRLQGVDVPALVEREPSLLLANVDVLLAEIRRIMPSADPVRFLARNPRTVMDMGQIGLHSTIDGNLVEP